MRSMEEPMTHIDSIFSKIKERDGMMMMQAYEFLPPENRMAYSTFKRKITDGRAVNGISRLKADKDSSAIFLTKNRYISARQMYLMILLAQ